MPRVSVIIPTFNRAAWLVQAIHSAQAQTVNDLEIIVVDDGSTDNTAAELQRFGTAVTYLSLPHCGLPAVARNAGLRAAAGDYIAFLDSDDLFLPGKMALQLSAFANQPQAGVIYSNGFYFRTEITQPTGGVQDGLPTPSGLVFGELLRGNFLAPPVMLIRRECLTTVGGFDERPDFRAVEDYDLWLRLAAQISFAYAPGQVAAIRRHPTNLSSDIAVLRSRVLKVLEKLEILHPDLVSQAQAALHEGYALNYCALAVAQWRQRHIPESIQSGLYALRYGLHLPWFGWAAWRAWQKRSRLRGDSSVGGIGR